MIVELSCLRIVQSYHLDSLLSSYYEIMYFCGQSFRSFLQKAFNLGILNQHENVYDFQ